MAEMGRSAFGQKPLPADYESHEIRPAGIAGDRQACFRESEGFDSTGVPIIAVWMFYNIITWYITHRAVSLNHRVEMERRLRSAMARVK